MNRGSSANGACCGELPKNGMPPSFEKGVKGMAGSPLICEAIDNRRGRPERLLVELRRVP